MSINRELSQFASFVEVDNTSRNIGIATTATPFVGIGTTNPIAKFEVVGQTELDDVNISGIASVGSLKIGATQVISSGRQLQNISSLDATTTATIEAAISNAPNTFSDLTVTGIATFNSSIGVAGIVTASVLQSNWSQVGLGLTFTTGVGTHLSVSGIGTIANLSSGIATVTKIHVGIATTYSEDLVVSGNARVTGIITIGTGSITLNGNDDSIFVGSGVTILGQTGIVSAYKFYGDGSSLTGTISGIGIRSEGTDVGYGATILDFRGAGVSTITSISSGIVTVFFEGGGSGTIGIGTQFPVSPAPSNGDLFYNADYGKLFVFYDENVINGIGTDSYWVDAAPFNVGIITSLSNVSFAPGSAASPSMYVVGDSQTGFFSPGNGQFTIVSSGSSILNINPSGIKVTGIATATDFDSLSDENYKENVTTVSDALNKINQMRGVRFDWKESGLPSYGVIAQELQNVLPELVHGQDPKTVNYNGIIGVLIEAIKELKAEVEELKKDK